MSLTNVVYVDSTHITGKTPSRPPGTLNDVTVTNPGSVTVPGPEVPAGTLGRGWLADFADVPQASSFHDDIETIFRDNITAGCGSGAFCPQGIVTRAQMAVLILRGTFGASYVPPPATGVVFADVPADAFAAAWIEDLFARGITSGCDLNPLRYCPDTPVTRQQMSVMLLRAKYGSDFAPPACAGAFGDVPCPSPYANWIEKLAVDGISVGCGAGNFCPRDSTLRQQMATFLVRTFQLAPTLRSGPRLSRPGRP